MRPIPVLLACVLSSVQIAWFSQIGSADEPNQHALTAKQILDRMAKTCAECKTYRDSGVVTTVFIEASGNQTVEKPFNTSFVRPDRFRFEYHKKTSVGQKERYIVWRKGKEVQTWWDIKPGVQKEESLDLAIAGATGVSGGSAHTIPALLLPHEVSGRPLTDLTESKRIDDGNLEKVGCFRIQANYADVPETLWIDKRSFLVRRIDAQEKFANFRTEETTTYEPVVDGEIPDKALEFNPPKAK